MRMMLSIKSAPVIVSVFLFLNPSSSNGLLIGGHEEKTSWASVLKGASGGQLVQDSPRSQFRAGRGSAVAVAVAGGRDEQLEHATRRDGNPPTAFSVERIKNFRNVSASVTYDAAVLPHPDMDMDSGVFTAPEAGIYLMGFEFWCWRGAAECRVVLVVNGNAVRTGRAVTTSVGGAGGSQHHQHVSTTAVLRMRRGDISSLILADGWLYSNARDRLTHFYGSLLHPE